MADSKPPANEMSPSDPTSEELVAYLDGELAPEEAESLATRLGLDPKLRAQADSLQRTWDILDILPHPQPSSTFATRTVSQLMVAPVSASSNPSFATIAKANSTMASIPRQRAGSAFWVSSALAIIAAGFGGYFAHQALAPPPKPAIVEAPSEDKPMLKNMRLYRNVDDIDYLKRLDSPELFGDPSES